jgi:hypothetical protein
MKNKILATFWTLIITLDIVGFILLAVYGFNVWIAMAVCGCNMCVLWYCLYDSLEEDKRNAKR